MINFAREDYGFYVQYVHNGIWKRAKHLDYINNHLNMVEKGIIDRLMIFMPPRHGKSMDVTETFPSYFIGKDPERCIIEVSYGGKFAERFGYRNKLKLQEHGKAIFDIELDRSNNSKTDWGIAGHRGGMVSVGLGGGITGKGADLLLIDDPIKNRQEADSLTYRQRLWDEWQNTLLTRLHPGGRVIIILTRWHEKDLAGQLLEEEGRIEDGGKWTVIDLPAIAEAPVWDDERKKFKIFPDALGRQTGQALWPEHGYDEEWAVKKKLEVGSYTWSALYQQRPTPKDAKRMFRKEWFTIVDDWPRDSRKIRYWDFAATEAKKGKDPDYTAGCFMAEKDGQYWIVDMRRDRLTPLNVERLVKSTAEADGRAIPIFIEQEGGSSGVSLIDHYRREVLKGFTFYADKKGVNKEIRAMPLSAAAEAGNVFLVRGAWNKDFLDEIDLFMTGMEDHDDQVDGASGAFEKISSVPQTDALAVPILADSEWTGFDYEDEGDDY